jgi:hypothetical protein
MYEELLWWLLMPSLLRLAGEITPNRAIAEEMSRNVEEALASAEAVGYRIDRLIGSVAAPAAAAKSVPESESEAVESETPVAEELEFGGETPAGAGPIRPD